MREELTVLWIGAQDEDERLMAELAGHLGRVFGCAAQSRRSADRPADTLDARRGQHSSSAILHWLAQAFPRQRTLAVTDVDLFLPVLTFVFGEAQLKGHAAVVSTARLVPREEHRDPHPRAADRAAVLRARLLTEAVHELGHTWGLVHCPDRGCAMARSGTLYDVDVKTPELCPDCASLLRAAGREGART